MVYHPKTELELRSLRAYLEECRLRGKEDNVDRWIRMVATSRLTGHSKCYFSVYTLPPNQAVTAEQQKKINEKLHQTPEYRDTKSIILRKTMSLIKKISDDEISDLRSAAKTARFLNADARKTSEIPSNSVQLTVTSPPFLDIVQYSNDNWLRCWFNRLDDKTIAKKITMSRNVNDWSNVMQNVFAELYRITRIGGWVAFEVGEVRNGTVKLDEIVVPLGTRAGFRCAGIIINAQTFTKTSNIWGVSNNRAGTNTNRIVLFGKG